MPRYWYWQRFKHHGQQHTSIWLFYFVGHKYTSLPFALVTNIPHCGFHYGLHFFFQGQARYINVSCIYLHFNILYYVADNPKQGKYVKISYRVQTFGNCIARAFSTRDSNTSLYAEMITSNFISELWLNANLAGNNFMVVFNFLLGHKYTRSLFALVEMMLHCAS